MIEENLQVLKLAVSIGESLLQSGGEIYRVEETIGRVLTAYGIEDYHVFVVSNGIFATIHEDRQDRGSMVRHVPLGSLHLGRVTRLNQLSREICSYTHTVDEAFAELAKCKSMPVISGLPLYLASGVGCASFCYIFGGRLYESLIAFLLGILLQLFVSTAQRAKVSKFIIYILGSGAVTLLSLILLNFFPNVMQDKVVIGSIIILLPGVSLTTSIRELFSGDYLSGSIHLIDALLNALCIAAGVGTAIKGFQLLGGVLL